jgi:hypothetical protein
MTTSHNTPTPRNDQAEFTPLYENNLKEHRTVTELRNYQVSRFVERITTSTAIHACLSGMLLKIFVRLCLMFLNFVHLNQWELSVGGDKTMSSPAFSQFLVSACFRFQRMQTMKITTAATTTTATTIPTMTPMSFDVD